MTDLGLILPGGGSVSESLRPDPPHPLAGTLRFIRYAFMPNRLQYCGGDDNALLFDHAAARQPEVGLMPLLRKFTGAFPYLQLIARSAGIADPFDDRVVEAYWIGNALLERVEVRQLYDSLRDRFGKQLSPRALALVAGKAPAGARPHHAFHVFDVHSRVGELQHSLGTMDSCRISWGQVVRADGAALIVRRQPLSLLDGKLHLADAVEERVTRQFGGRGFVADIAPDAWVALHWGWVCEVLTEEQRRNLERYTRHHLALANATL